MKIKSTFWSWSLKNIILQSGDIFFGQRMVQRLRFLESAQWWSREKIEEEKNKLLQNLMKIAYEEVPYYRNKIDELEINPSTVKTQEDLRKLPIFTKEELRNAYPNEIVRSTPWPQHESFTSGSTGKNFCVRGDTETTGWYRASFLLALQWAGWSLGERHLQTGMTLNRSIQKKIKDWMLGCRYVSAFDLSDKQLQKNLELMEKDKINHLWGYPGSLYYLARYAMKKGWNRPLHSIVTWGDNLTPKYRETIEGIFGSRVMDTYGCAEGMHVSAQCEKGNYHIHSLDIIVEYVDEKGNPVPEGTLGYLVLTRLHPGPMPFLRYRIGDMGISAKSENCSCQRKFELMKSVQGRATDVILTPSGNRLIVHFFTGILEHFSEIDSFQVIQEKEQEMILRIVPNGNFSNEIENKIRSIFKEKNIDDMKINIELVKEIPLESTGKRKFIINHLLKTGIKER